MCRCSVSGKATALGVPGSEDSVGARFKRVDPRYFETLDIPVVKGRGISDRDRAGAPRVVVINETLAGRLAERFGMTDPVGKNRPAGGACV